MEYNKKKKIIAVLSIVLFCIAIVFTFFLLKDNNGHEEGSYLSIQDIDDKNAVEVSFNQLMSSVDYQKKKEEDKIDSVKNLLLELEKDKLIEKDSITYNETTKIFNYNYACGITGSISIKEEENYTTSWLNPIGLEGKTAENAISLTPNNKSSDSKNNDIIDSVLMYGFDKKSEKDRCFNEWSELCEAKSMIETEILDCPTVFDFKTALLDKKYICIFEHGDYGGVVADSYVFKVQDEDVTKDTDLAYNKDLYYKRIVCHTEGSGETFYCITPKFFEFYYQDQLTDSIIYLISCEGFGVDSTVDYGIADTLIEECGAKTVVGFHNSVVQCYAYRIYDTITDLLLKGYTVGDAYDSILDELGATDYTFLKEHLYEIEDMSVRKQWLEAAEKKKEGGAASFLLYGDESATLIPTYTLKGETVDRETNKSISNVKIEVVDNKSDSDDPIVTATTDEKGSFSFKVPYGSYSISFQHDKYEYYGTSLSIETDDEFTSPILLTPKKDKCVKTEEYIGRDIVTVANEIGSMRTVDVTDGSLEYRNEYLTLGTSPQEKNISFISIDGRWNNSDDNQCSYSLYDIYIGEDLNRAIEHLKGSGWSINSRSDNEDGTHHVKLKKNNSSISLLATSNNEVNSISLVSENFSNQTYWVIFSEGYRNDRIEMSTIDSSLPPDDLYIIWDTSLVINNSSKSGKCKQYYRDENGEWIYMGEYGRLTDKATKITASNLDIYDKDGNLIMEKTSYYDINWDKIDSYR